MVVNDIMGNNEKTKYSVVQGVKEGKPWFATIREDYQDFRGRPDIDWLLEIHVGIEGLGRPLPSKDEAAVLNQFEDMLGETLKGTDANAFFIARTTWNGLRSIFYRISTPEVVSAELDLLIAQEKYPREFEYKISKDSDWKIMSKFFPQ